MNIEQQRAAFEALFPMPEGTCWAGNGYAVTGFGGWEAIYYCYKWAGYQAALESPEVQTLRNDSERLEFLIAEECQVKTMTSLRKGKWYHLYWPDSEEMQDEWFTNPRAAIDAAIDAAMEKQK